jgi:hypothetical protein
LVIGEEEAVFSRSVGILPTSSILVGRCGLAAPIFSEKIYRKAAKVAKERRGESDWRAQEEAASLKEGHGRPARVLS